MSGMSSGIGFPGCELEAFGVWRLRPFKRGPQLTSDSISRSRSVCLSTCTSRTGHGEAPDPRGAVGSGDVPLPG